MDFATIKSIADAGLGTTAFVVLILGGRKVYTFMDLLVNNHLTHIQASLEDVGKHTEAMASHMEGLAEAVKSLKK